MARFHLFEFIDHATAPYYLCHANQHGLFTVWRRLSFTCCLLILPWWRRDWSSAPIATNRRRNITASASQTQFNSTISLWYDIYGLHFHLLLAYWQTHSIACHLHMVESCILIWLYYSSLLIPVMCLPNVPLSWFPMARLPSCYHCFRLSENTRLTKILTKDWISGMNSHEISQIVNNPWVYSSHLPGLRRSPENGPRFTFRGGGVAFLLQKLIIELYQGPTWSR